MAATNSVMCTTEPDEEVVFILLMKTSGGNRNVNVLKSFGCNWRISPCKKYYYLLMSVDFDVWVDGAVWCRATRYCRGRTTLHEGSSTVWPTSLTPWQTTARDQQN